MSTPTMGPPRLQARRAEDRRSRAPGCSPRPHLRGAVPTTSSSSPPRPSTTLGPTRTHTRTRPRRRRAAPGRCTSRPRRRIPRLRQLVLPENLPRRRGRVCLCLCDQKKISDYIPMFHVIDRKPRAAPPSRTLFRLFNLIPPLPHFLPPFLAPLLTPCLLRGRYSSFYFCSLHLTLAQ